MLKMVFALVSRGGGEGFGDYSQVLLAVIMGNESM
jgi:hypothetical protein